MKVGDLVKCLTARDSLGLIKYTDCDGRRIWVAMCGGRHNGNTFPYREHQLEVVT